MSYMNGFEIHPHPTTPASAVQLLSGYATSIVSDVMGGRLVGSSDLRPVHRSVLSACGQAVTVKVRGGDNLMIHKALATLTTGDVLVIDGEGDVGRALVGEIMSSVARKRGTVAFVVDGAVRDADSFETHRFPCWARGVNLRGPYKDGPGSINVPVVVGGMRKARGEFKETPLFEDMMKGRITDPVQQKSFAYWRTLNDLDKWFALQATIPEPDTLSRVRGLMSHPMFSMANPNRLRALVGALPLDHDEQRGREFVSKRREQPRLDRWLARARAKGARHADPSPFQDDATFKASPTLPRA